MKPPETNTSAPSPNGHLAYLDGMRACAALYVVAHHAMMSIPYMEHEQGINGKIGKLLSFGHAAVDLFIVLSGFCFMLPLLRKEEIKKVDVKTFLLRRARRILPPYYFALGLSLVLIFLLVPTATSRNVWAYVVPVTWHDTLLHLFLVHDAYKPSRMTINYTFWSIAVEWRIYFAFPILVALWIKIGAYRTTLLAIATGYVMLVLLRFTSVNTTTAGVSPHFLGLFTLGMLAANIAFARPESHFSKLKENTILWRVLTVVFAILTLVGTKLPVPRTYQTPVCDIFVGLFSASLLILISTGEKNWLRNLLGTKPLVFVGTFAYSLYLVHAPLLEILWRYGVRPLALPNLASFGLMSTVGIGIVVLCAYVFFLFCERPFLRAAAKKTVPSEKQELKVEDLARR